VVSAVHCLRASVWKIDKEKGMASTFANVDTLKKGGKPLEIKMPIDHGCKILMIFK
jgi:hypothetical protein